MWVVNTFTRGYELLNENLDFRYEMFFYKLLFMETQQAPPKD